VEALFSCKVLFHSDIFFEAFNIRTIEIKLEKLF